MNSFDMTIGLMIFVVVALTNVAALNLDVFLAWLDLPTITMMVRDHPWSLGIPIFAFQSSGIVGLFWHFFGG